MGEVDVQSMVFCSVLGGLVSLLVIPLLLLPELFRSTVDRRRSLERVVEGVQRTVTFRLGGLALVTAFLSVAALIHLLYPSAIESRSHTCDTVVFASLAMFVAGLWHDVRPVRTTKKLLIQTLIATVACTQGVVIDALQNPFGASSVPLGIWGGTVTVLWLVGVTNLISFVDRVDGLAGAVGLTLMGLLAYLAFGLNAPFAAMCAIGMFGALLGFLVYNFPLARIRMGSSGTAFVGFLIGSLPIANPHHEGVLSAGMFMLVILGASFLFLSRGWLGRLLPDLPSVQTAEPLPDRLRGSRIDFRQN
jgi:UDP-GlcNAc:undecaprenyl-phosphate GlcNAc-1-phosphate transferase